MTLTQITHADLEADDLLSSGAAAATLGVHRDTIKRWEAAGYISSQRTPTGHRRYRRADVEALLTNGTRSAVSA